MFESLLWDRLSRLDPARPVYVESESKKIGALQVPQALLDAMWRSRCVQLEVDRATRVRLLMDEYAHFLADPVSLGRQLDCLLPLHGHATIEHWKQMAAGGDWDALVAELLERHYDPAYTRAIVSHYPDLSRAQKIGVTSAEEASFVAAARALLGEDSLEPVT